MRKGWGRAIIANRTYTPGKHYHIINLEWSVDRQTHVQSNQIHYYHPRHKQCFNDDNQATSICRGDCIGGDGLHEGVQIVRDATETRKQRFRDELPL